MFGFDLVSLLVGALFGHFFLGGIINWARGLAGV
jgi:hypothetical protein